MTSFPSLDDRLRMALAEDLAEAGDLTCRAIFSNETAQAVIRAKAAGVLSAVDVAKRVFQLHAETKGAEVQVECLKKNGDRLEPGDEVMSILGQAAILLGAERVALNLMQQMSGVATLAAACVAAAGSILVVDTRKTVPLWRDLQKQAVRDGGGSNHRIGLYDAYMIKDNHIDAAGSVVEAIEKVYAFEAANPRTAGDGSPERRELTVEVRDLDELRAALSVIRSDDFIMLDNMRGAVLLEALEIVGNRAQTELSGGLRQEQLADVADLSLTRISMGSLTHSAPALDLSMKIVLD
jgi:nicotinate-nucleotide pyrophosphorylase (carboxylating)